MQGDPAEDQYAHVFQHTSGWVSSGRLVDLASRWLVVGALTASQPLRITSSNCTVVWK